MYVCVAGVGVGGWGLGGEGGGGGGRGGGYTHLLIAPEDTLTYVLAKRSAARDFHRKCVYSTVTYYIVSGEIAPHSSPC